MVLMLTSQSKTIELANVGYFFKSQFHKDERLFSYLKDEPSADIWG